MIKKSTSDLVLSHREYVKNFTDSRLEIYKLRYKSIFLSSHWIELYGDFQSSYRHNITEKYLIPLLKNSDNLKRKRIYRIDFGFLLPRQIFSNQDLKINLINKLLWVISNFFYHFLIFFKSISVLLKFSIQKRRDFSGKTIIYGVTEDALLKSKKIELRNFRNCLLTNNYIDKDITISNPVSFIKSSLNNQGIESFSEKKKSQEFFIKIQYFLKGLIIIFKGILDLFLGNKFSLLTVVDFLKVEYINLHKTINLPEIIFYPIHSGLFLPPEIMAMKKKGSKVILFEFSQSYIFPRVSEDDKKEHSFYSLKYGSHPFSEWKEQYLPSEIWVYDKT